MIVITLSGGLGNQLFQYAYGRSLMAKHEVKFLLNTTERGYQLGHFNTKINLTTNPVQPCVRRTHIPYDPDPLPDPCTVDSGYWQCEKYFSNIEDELRAELTLREPLSTYAKDLSEEMKNTNSVFISVRKGDVFDSLPMDYYRRALDLIDKPHIFSFSDAPVDLPFPTVTVSHTPTEGMHLMSQCRHAILSNSTYAWWGAWLNPDKDRTVVAPDPWFSSSPELWKDIIPDRWKKVDR